MNNEEVGRQNICLMFNCSECCKPVKIHSYCVISENLPFVDNHEIFIPVEHPDTVRLKTYKCKKFNQATGKCNDYNNRPQICRNAKCKAFETTNKKDQARIIKEVKSSKFYRIRMEDKNV